MNIQDTINQWAGHLAPYAQHAAVGAGAAGALISLYTIRRFLKTREHDDMAASLGVLLFAVVTTEGMWEVVHNKLGVNIPLTVAMFAAFDVVIYSQGRLAIRKLTANPKAPVGTYLAIIWALSIAASVTVSTAGGNLTTQLFRFFSPLVAAALWSQKVFERRNGKAERAESNWIWTPDRLLVRWGLKKPGAVDDLSGVFARRRITALVDAGLVLHAARESAKSSGGQVKPSRWRNRRDPLVVARQRVQRLAKSADRADLAAAREQVLLTLNAETELFRSDDAVSGHDRDALEEVRLMARQAADRVRVDHMRTVAGIRMPAAVADQIPDQIPDQWMDQFRTSSRTSSRTSRVDQFRTNGVDQVPDQPHASRVDQSRTNQPAVVQPPTSGSVPAARTGPEVRATVKLDRTRPVSPAVGGDVPPRIKSMVRDLKKVYRAEIPGRRTVMDRMGWTSVGDAQTVINMVRAERAEKANT